MQDVVQAIGDIDTCDIYVLKSIAKMIGAEHITNFITTDYPKDLLNLINLFSMPKHYLIKSNTSILHYTSVLEVFGEIENRNMTLLPDNYQLSLLQDIANNIENFYFLFKENNIPIDNTEIYDFPEEYNIINILNHSLINGRRKYINI